MAADAIVSDPPLGHGVTQSHPKVFGHSFLQTRGGPVKTFRSLMRTMDCF